MVADDLEQRLSKLGYQPVEIVDTGEGAVTRALELRPDLVLMDIRLKGQIDGIEAAGQLRVPYHIPVVFLTSHSDESTLERAGVSEPFGYLTKPFEERSLQATVEMALYRHRAEERLRKLERWLATMLRSIGDAVIATDTSGLITYINPVAETLTQRTMCEAIGRPLHEVFAVVQGPNRIPLPNLVRRILQEGMVINLSGDIELISPTGRSVAIADSAAPIRDDDGTMLGTVIVFRDATEQRQTEVELRLHQQALHRQLAERTKALESADSNIAADNLKLQAAHREIEMIVSVLSHDLRAPLRAIHGLASMLGEDHGSSLNDEGQRLLQAVTENSHRLVVMMEAFLGFVRLGQQVLRRRAVDMTALVLQAIDSLPGGPPKSAARFETSVLSPTEGDGILLREVWGHLLDNALKFSAGSNPPVIRVISRKDGPDTIYSIQDNGVGFDFDYSEKLFDIFHRLHRQDAFPGIGVGLARAARIVRLHGGRIWAESKPGRGATFHFSLCDHPPAA